jgi:histidinol phosphatase-like PHP family hydrolase
LSNPIYVDFHVHTRFSPCGKRDATLTVMVDRARAKGLAALGFADHVTPTPIPGCGFYDGQQIEVLYAEHGIVNAIDFPADLTVLVGVEADYTLAGAGCLDAAMLDQAEHVICSASHFHLPTAPQPRADTPEAKADLMVQMAREMLQIPGVSVWAHPFDCSEMRPLAPIMAAIGEARMAELIASANARQVAVEINGGPAATCPAYREATAAFFCLAREMGSRFTITADAHHPDDLDRLDLALDWAREMGFQDEDFLTVDELRERR